MVHCCYVVSLHTCTLPKSSNRVCKRFHYYFKQTVICKQKRSLEFVQDSSNQYVVRIKPRVVKRRVIEEHTNQSQQSEDNRVSIENERTNINVLFPFVSQVVVNSLEALWLLSTQLLTYLSKKEVNQQKFHKKLITLVVAVWVLLRVIAVFPLLPEALELTGLVASVVVFYR